MNYLSFKKITLVLGVLFLSACAAYTLVPAGNVTTKGMTFKSGMSWNKVANSPYGKKTEMWTADGLFLNRVILVGGVIKGEGMFKTFSKDTPMPLFNPGMLPHELEGFIKTSLVNSHGGSLTIETMNLKPRTISDEVGVEFDLSYFNDDGLLFMGKVASVIKGEKLYAMIYLATSMHYYDLYDDEINNMMESIIIQ